MLAFGHGVHACLGKHVALMEANPALPPSLLNEEIDRVPSEFELAIKRIRNEVAELQSQCAAAQEVVDRQALARESDPKRKPN